MLPLRHVIDLRPPPGGESRHRLLICQRARAALPNQSHRRRLPQDPRGLREVQGAV